MNNNNLITVFTPVYNRCQLLKNLYESLMKQDSHSFEWLIVDDGSTDNCKNTVQEFIDEGILSIQYIYQENHGKYVAHNVGVKNCLTELFVCVDSDDYLMPNAISRIIEVWENIRDDQGVSGIVSPKKMSDIGGLMQNPPMYSTLMNLYNSGCLKGETMLVFKTEILKKYLFPELPGENFMSESVIYDQMDQDYQLFILNEFLYVAEYQNDGLTKNIMRTHWNNPKSTLTCYYISAVCQDSFIKAVKSFACYLAWKDIRKVNIVKIGKPKFFVFIFGSLIQFHYRLLFRKQSKEMKFNL